MAALCRLITTFGRLGITLLQQLGHLFAAAGHLCANSTCVVLAGAPGRVGPGRRPSVSASCHSKACIVGLLGLNTAACCACWAPSDAAALQAFTDCDVALEAIIAVVGLLHTVSFLCCLAAVRRGLHTHHCCALQLRPSLALSTEPLCLANAAVQASNNLDLFRTFERAAWDGRLGAASALTYLSMRHPALLTSMCEVCLRVLRSRNPCAASCTHCCPFPPLLPAEKGRCGAAAGAAAAKHPARELAGKGAFHSAWLHG